MGRVTDHVLSTSRSQLVDLLIYLRIEKIHPLSLELDLESEVQVPRRSVRVVED